MAAVEGLVPFCCGLLMGQTDQTIGKLISAYKILGFRWFKDIWFRLKVIMGDLLAAPWTLPGNILQICMSDHEPKV